MAKPETKPAAETVGEIAQKALNRSLTKGIQLLKTAKEFNKDGDMDTAKDLVGAAKKLLEV